MFRGRFAHTIDTKGRVSIPAGFRVELQRRSERAPILTNDRNCLALFPFEDWCEYERKIMKAGSVRPQARSFIRFMVSGATECPIDAQGRVLIPPPLREYARLEREVIVAGVGDFIELWDKAQFETELSRTLANFDDIASTVDGKVE